MEEKNLPLDIDSFWEYSDPAASEERFRRALDSASGYERLELQTQIARTYGLRGQYAEAHAILDEVGRELAGAGPRPTLRYLLERGRTFNSSGDKEQARGLFLEAWKLGQITKQDGLAVDAAHMLAITYMGEPEAIKWNRRGLAIARTSVDPKARALIPAMLNNIAWDLYDLGRSAEALPFFEEALTEWTSRGKEPQIRAAKWAVAFCLRSLGRHEQALKILRELEQEYAALETEDGTVFEELAENLAALGEMEEARIYFGKAYELLSQEEWYVENEAERLARLKSQAQKTDLGK